MRNAAHIPPPGSSISMSVTGGTSGGVVGAVGPMREGSAPVRVGGNISAPRRIADAAPVMPEVARQADVRGVVILEITIGTDGSVTDARVLRSIPLLDKAAVDTVRQWRYEPTLLNGAAVPVVLTVTVNFQ
jgi:TonB family protein